jgi:hypothetical protein
VVRGQYWNIAESTVGEVRVDRVSRIRHGVENIGWRLGGAFDLAVSSANQVRLGQGLQAHQWGS